MILKIRSWCEGIIVAIIISIIVEILIPEGNNKKYVKVIVGIYIMFVTINPILEFLNFDIEFENTFFTGTVQASSNLDNNIKDVYIIGIEEAIKKDIFELGYIVNNVTVRVDENYENIVNIEIVINGNKGEIEPIVIGNQNLEHNDYKDIIQLLKENYLVQESQIIIKEN